MIKKVNGNASNYKKKTNAHLCKLLFINHNYLFL